MTYYDLGRSDKTTLFKKCIDVYMLTTNNDSMNILSKIDDDDVIALAINNIETIYGNTSPLTRYAGVYALTILKNTTGEERLLLLGDL